VRMFKHSGGGGGVGYDQDMEQKASWNRKISFGHSNFCSIVSGV